MLLLFVILIVCAVKCDDSYYVVEIPNEELRAKKDFNVYWNVPTSQCKHRKIFFENLYEKFGILQNENDDFRGDKVTILYDPGFFPALLKNMTSGKFRFRNGGVPQAQTADLERHLDIFTENVTKSIPDKDFDGVGVIDFESWRPILRQNFGSLTPYKDVSYDIERKLHWWLPEKWIIAEATRRFESSARLFMETTLLLARVLRPRAKWGYYAFPYCYNMASNNLVEDCAGGVMKENDRTEWLWRESTALFPSLYSSISLSTSQLVSLVKGRMKEAARLAWGSPILPYFWYRYREGGFLSQKDLNGVLDTLYKSNASGFIIWGASADVSSVDKCNKLHDYVYNVMGPAIAKYTKSNLRDEIIDTFNNFNEEKDTNVEEIKKEVADEIKNKLNNSDSNEISASDEKETIVNNNILIDLIVNSMVGNDFVQAAQNVFNIRTSPNNTKDINSKVISTSESFINDENSNRKRYVIMPIDFSTKSEILSETTTESEIFSENYSESELHSENTESNSISKATTAKESISYFITSTENSESIVPTSEFYDNTSDSKKDLITSTLGSVLIDTSTVYYDTTTEDHNADTIQTSTIVIDSSTATEDIESTSLNNKESESELIEFETTDSPNQIDITTAKSLKPNQITGIESDSTKYVETTTGYKNFNETTAKEELNTHTESTRDVESTTDYAIINETSTQVV